MCCAELGRACRGTSCWIWPLSSGRGRCSTQGVGRSTLSLRRHSSELVEQGWGKRRRRRGRGAASARAKGPWNARAVREPARTRRTATCLSDGSVTIAKVSGSSSVPVVDPAASHLNNEESAEAPASQILGQVFLAANILVRWTSSRISVQERGIVLCCKAWPCTLYLL